MKREDHLAVDLVILGKEYPKVHAWLDGNFWKFKKNPYKHWLDCHHREAIIKKWGIFTPEYQSACMHVLWDCFSHFGILCLPETQEEVNALLKEENLI